MNSLTIGVSLAIMILGLVGALICLEPTKATVGRLSLHAFFVGLFFVVWSLSGHVWRLS